METLVDARIATDKQDCTLVEQFNAVLLYSNPDGSSNQQQHYMIPDIPIVAGPATQGTDFTTAVRTGNRVKLKSCTFSGVLHVDSLLAYDAGRNANLFVRAMLISDKQNPQKLDSASAWDPGVLGGPSSAEELYRENDEGPSKAFGSTTHYTNWMSPINHQRFTVHDEKRIKITNGCGAYDPTAGNAASGALIPVPGVRKFNMSLKCKSRYLHYEKSASMQPSGVAPFLVFHIVTMHGATVANGVVRFSGKCRTVWENL